MSYLTYIETGAGARLDPNTPHSAAPAEALRARYDLERVRQEVTRETIARGPANLWRYAPLLPVAHPEQAVSLGEGWTPLLKTPRLARAMGLQQLQLFGVEYVAEITYRAEVGFQT